MRSRAVAVVVSLLSLALTSCDSRPAEEGGGGVVPVSGAHTAHITGIIAKPIDCGECHDRAFQVTLQGQLANANGADPSFNGTALTCSNVYCHAGGTTLAIGGGTFPAPVWNPPSVLGCVGCHAAPGGAVDTSAWHPAVAPAVQCAICHPDYTNETVDRDVHVNGVVNLTVADMATNCSACHGDAAREVPDGTPEATAVALRAAPPVDRSGAEGTESPGVGAHQSHLLPGPGAISAPIACSECHVVPQDLGHVGPLASTPAKLTWGPIARAKGATPGFDTVSLTCANYCHGQTLGGGGSNLAPIWNQVDGTQASCGTCHASAPPDPSHLLHASPDLVALACSHCHPDGYTATSVGPAAVPVHVNGVVNTSATFLPDWDATAAGPNGWTGTSVVGCHGGTRYWKDAVPPTGGCW